MAFIDVPNGSSVVADLLADGNVSRVEADRVRTAEADPSDSGYADQWSLPKIGWNNVFGSPVSGSAVVALLDTGVDASHPDLAGQLVPGTSILDGSAGTTDPNGHGTAMAGIIAAVTDNGQGIAGIGYAGVKVMPITVLDANGEGSDSDIIQGVVWAVQHGADVINMSFSNPGYSAALQAAIDYAWAHNVVVVAATGNDGSSTVTFPAGDRGVIGVSNTDQNDGLNASSNFGADTFLGAPGTDILTLTAGGGTASVTGTSASAAEVSAAAALLRALDPSASNGVIVGRLGRTADAAGTVDQTGNGRLNLERAFADTSTGSVEPVGAAPLGSGGPIVGPYVAASNAVVSGTVRDSVTLLPLSGVTVTASGGGSGSDVTDGTGAYSFSVSYSGNGPAAVTVAASAIAGYTVTAGSSGSTSCSGNGNGTCTPAVVNLTLTPTPNKLSINDVAAAEGTGAGTATFTFTVTRANRSGTSTVAFATAAGTATAGANCTGATDYVTTSGTLTFGIGVTSQPIAVTVCHDATFEVDETFNVNLSSPTNATITDNSGLGTIQNDDTAPTLSINDVSAPEGTGAGTTTFTFTVTQSAVSGLGTTVAYTTAPGTATGGASCAGTVDYTTTSGTATIPTGSTSTTINVTVCHDAVFEADETFAVSLSSPTNATIADNQGLGTIQNDDTAPSLSINDVSALEGNAAPGTPRSPSR